MEYNRKCFIQREYNQDLQRVEERYTDSRIKEYYYTAEWWSSNFPPFLEHVQQYVNGERTVPVCKTSSTIGESMFFTFSNDLYRLVLDDFPKLKKPFEAALKYGFRGYSRGGRNGVFLLRKQDCGLLSDIENLINKHAAEIMQDLDCSMEEFSQLKRVKIVCHEPGGSRVLGVMNQENGRALFLGFGQY